MITVIMFHADPMQTNIHRLFCASPLLHFPRGYPATKKRSPASYLHEVLTLSWMNVESPQAHFESIPAPNIQNVLTLLYLLTP